MTDLYREVRRTRVLVRAWHSIRRNAETSQREKTKQAARDFGSDLPANLRKISDRLREGYTFSKAYGALPPKGPGKKGKRPIVIAPLADRIVQRAILDVLQDAKHLLAVQRVLSTPTSIGGIPGKGVEQAISLFQARIDAGDRFVAGSDISGFFTKIPLPRVREFMMGDGVPQDFLTLVDAAMKVDLENAGAMDPEDLRLFPTDEQGVAQGCPLSALAGNIVLADFDAEMNDRGITCIRYIDDFVLVGRTQKAVMKAMASARETLRTLEMDIYDPGVRADKAFAGGIERGHDFLGYRLIPGSYPPSESATRRLLEQVRSLMSQGKKAIRRAARGETLRPHERCYAQTLVAIDQTLRGWRGSYQASDCPEIFRKLDAQIDRELLDFRQFYNEKIAAVDPSERRRLMKVQKLAD